MSIINIKKCTHDDFADFADVRDIGLEDMQEFYTESFFDEDKNLARATYFVLSYDVGEYIYPKDICDKFNVSMDETYDFLEACADNGLIEQCMKIICPECDELSEEAFKTIEDIPENYKCKKCGNIIPFLDILTNDGIIVYERIESEL